MSEEKASGLFERGTGVKVLEGIAAGEHAARSLTLDPAPAAAGHDEGDAQ